MTVCRSLLLVALVAIPSLAAAQAPLVPGQVIALDVANPGQKASGTTTVLRPEANLAFEYRIDGAATPIAAVKAAACTPVSPAPALTCTLIPPTLSSGTHAIEIRATVSPAEAGVGPSAYAPSLAVAMILVTGPSTPTNPRVTSLP